MTDNRPEYRKGYVTIKVTHAAPERFLNLCANRGICLYDLQILEQEILVNLRKEDFFRLKPLVRKSGVRIRILKKYGLPFLFYRNKKRKAFFVGSLLCALLIAMLSAHIWNIHVEGNRQVSKERILDFLEQEHIFHGISKSKVNCSAIAAAIRREFPQVTWVSAKIVGTRLKLTIQENTDRVEAILDEEKTPCNIVADESGAIVRMVTKRGVPLVFPGDTCQKGDLLVSGCLEITNDNGEVTRYEYVPAEADICIRRAISYEDCFALKHKEKVFTGNIRKSWGIQAGNYRGELGFFKKLPEYTDLLCEQQRFFLTENFCLPVVFLRMEAKEYQMQETCYTKEEAKNLAIQKLENFQKNLMEKGVQIYKNNVKIETDETTCSSYGTILVDETIGQEVPVEQTAPQEPEQEEVQTMTVLRKG